MPPSRTVPTATKLVATPRLSVEAGASTWSSLEDVSEQQRLLATNLRPREERSARGQFFTPWTVAQRLASLFDQPRATISILDPGAGIGSLTAALVESLLNREQPPKDIQLTAIEADPNLIPALKSTLEVCRAACLKQGVQCTFTIHEEDFLHYAAQHLQHPLTMKGARFDSVIMNPPYLKLSSTSKERALLNSLNLPTSNLYTAFLGLATLLLQDRGEIVAITPRSFCNGPYFAPFRRFFFDQVTLRSIHIYTTRNKAFNEDAVLQENIILGAVKRTSTPNDRVNIFSSADPSDEDLSVRSAPYAHVISSKDPHRILHVAADELQQDVAHRMAALPATLSDLHITASTGKVVDFRSKAALRTTPDSSTVPLIYPVHLERGGLVWPRIPSRKPNAIVRSPQTEQLLIPVDVYVLVKRFSAKEEKKRLVASVITPDDIPSPVVGIENHLNYLHHNGKGLPLPVARGLALFLNSTIADEYFRQFNGHTQVNAADLKSLRYPSRADLAALGQHVTTLDLPQDTIDQLIEQEVFHMTPNTGNSPSKHKARVEQAIAILKALGLPRQQQNERSALTLLALLNLKPHTPWKEAKNPLRGITEMMDYFKEHYGKQYAPNTRETVRRQTVHQFLDAGICIQNPDSTRPTNSPQFSYQVPDTLLPLFQAFSTPAWDSLLKGYLQRAGKLSERYAKERDMQRIPVVLPGYAELTLSPGEHNQLVKSIIDEFCPRFTPGGRVLYIGDTEDKWIVNQREELAALGVTVDHHGKMPDVVIHFTKKNWLLLVEAVTSHGPVNPKRHQELATLFKGSTAGIVYVTAFLTRKAFSKYLHDISWETEVWIAESPSHLIHFDGERFLGPYPSSPR